MRKLQAFSNINDDESSITPYIGGDEEYVKNPSRNVTSRLKSNRFGSNTLHGMRQTSYTSGGFNRVIDHRNNGIDHLSNF